MVNIMDGFFDLDPQLQTDAVYLGDFELCALLMSRDANYPWFILVPRRRDISEIYQLDDKDQQQLWFESAILSRVIMAQFDGQKLNVAALGNIVSQLHVHHIVRYHHDLAWPGPVWGVAQPKNYLPEYFSELQKNVWSKLKNKGFQKKIVL
jgi:diadenosine tetraphosphate (Ap4A) HIT family hydrolase